MTVCKNSIQNELKLPDGTIWVGKAEEPVQPGSHFYIGKKIYNQEKYDGLLGMRSEIVNPGYFPKYRG